MKTAFRIIIGTVVIIGIVIITGIALDVVFPKFDGGPGITTSTALASWTISRPDDLTNGPQIDAFKQFLQERRLVSFPASELTNHVRPRGGMPSVKDGYGRDIMVRIDRLDPDPHGLTVDLSFKSLGRNPNVSTEAYTMKVIFYLRYP